MTNTLNLVEKLGITATRLFNDALGDNSVITIEMQDVKKLEKLSTEVIGTLFSGIDLEKLASEIDTYLYANKCTYGIIIVETSLDLKEVLPLLETNKVENIDSVLIALTKTTDENTTALCIGYR